MQQSAHSKQLTGYGRRACSPPQGYAECMRTHEVPAFPDPGVNGGLAIPNAGDESSPIFHAAASACKGLLPVSGLPASSENQRRTGGTR